MISPTAYGDAALAEPRGTLVEPCGTLWNLASGPPRTTPEPIWAETPKFSAVEEKGELKHAYSSCGRMSAQGICIFLFSVVSLFSAFSVSGYSSLRFAFSDVFSDPPKKAKFTGTNNEIQQCMI